MNVEGTWSSYFCRKFITWKKEREREREKSASSQTPTYQRVLFFLLQTPSASSCPHISETQALGKTELCGFSPQANYTDLATDANFCG
jgi:hypothetical protein